ncbi:TrkA family potassium uptake protein [Thermopolyspora sp. NPDC052614]|uniref:potassium channel family protein n=1 Tax=Thermopolyspora sp. NPDC052614 TaxID=3155682 RepID=UPI00341FB281
MRILIAGAGRLGEQAAYLLSGVGHQITVIERTRGRLAELGGHDLYRLVHGDACEPRVLEEAGALTADLVLAATGEDEDNLVIALLAKRTFAVPRVLARVNDPDNAWLFDDRWGVDVALPAAAPMVSLVEEAAGASDTIGVVRLAAAGVNLIETCIADTSAAVGRALADLPLPPDALVAAVIHEGRPAVPDAAYRLRPGDTVLVLTTTTAESVIHDVFQSASPSR